MMNELSLHILDIVQNSVAARAKHIEIDVLEDKEKDRLEIRVKDDGAGMTPELLKNVTDPFVTTRTTRKVGLGIPLLKFAAESTGGSFSIESEVGKGTVIDAVFTLSHIDRAPLGNMAETMESLVVTNPEIEFTYKRQVGEKRFMLSTEEMKTVLGGLPISSPEVLMWVKDTVNENEKELNGGA
ncbi:MAG: ATP-binding protein [Bacillota bacterium]|nr:ATP-binding protein [Bacillota bacterium]